MYFFERNPVSGEAAGFRIVPAPETEASSVGNQSVSVLSH